MANLLISVGMPGCGKSTWARKFLDLKYAVVSSDAIRKKAYGSLVAAHAPGQKQANNEQVFNEFHRQIGEYLRHDVDVFADATSLNPFARQRLRDIAAATGAKTHLLFFKNPDQAIMRNHRRDEDQVVPDDAMMTMYAKYIECLRDIPQEQYDSVTEISSVR